ncbi:MAG: hypothetical protein KGZ71_05545 [Desulfobulbaceae bacterium]|nr:hypothetical protein [Candidatus Kapabacteria bacterium]MBS3999927.1 hypothetical protein [Desulfobulbaceae bacterium]
MKGNFLHWLLGVPAVIFILLFTILPLYEAIDKIFMTSEIFISIVSEKHLQPWFFETRETYIFANLVYGILNATFLAFSTIYLYKKKSVDLLIAFMIFLGFHFLVLFLAGNWLAPGQ